MAKKKIIKGYKVFEPDWTCKGFKYKVGCEYKMDEDIEVCKRGFHFCENLNDCFEFYNFDSRNKVAEIEALGIVKRKKEDIKSVTNHIKIIKEITWLEVCELVNNGESNTGRGNSGDRNSGDCNSGYCNSGDRNSGDRNSGYCNSGDRNSGYCNSGDRNSGNWNSGNWNSGNWNSGNWNSGDWNSGDWNSGDWNSGNCNSGDWNSGDRNSGDRNSGDRNSGYCNSGDWNSGIFNSRLAVINLFNKSTKMTMDEIKIKHEIAINAILYSNFPLNKWVSEEKMAEDEKEEHPEYKKTGGYLKTLTYQEAWAIMWENFHNKEKEAIMKLPNFDKDVFKEITGIKV